MDLCNKVISRFFVSSNKDQPLNESVEETVCNSTDTNSGFEILFPPENDICRLRDIYYNESQADISLCLKVINMQIWMRKCLCIVPAIIWWHG